MKNITVLDLFSGIGGFHLGLEKAGYNVKSFYSEIDKHAIAVYKNNFKNSNMSDQLQMFEENNYQKSTLSPLEALAKALVLLEIVKGWEDNDQALSLKQFASLGNADQEFLSGKMLKERSPQIIAKTLQQSCKRLPTLGVIDLNGNCLIQAGFYPKIERESTLSDILQKKVEDKYFLSETTVKRIMSYKSNTLQRLPSSLDTQPSDPEVTLLNVKSMHKK